MERGTGKGNRKKLFNRPVFGRERKKAGSAVPSRLGKLHKARKEFGEIEKPNKLKAFEGGPL